MAPSKSAFYAHHKKGFLLCKLLSVKISQNEQLKKKSKGRSLAGKITATKYSHCTNTYSYCVLPIEKLLCINLEPKFAKSDPNISDL